MRRFSIAESVFPGVGSFSGDGAPVHSSHAGPQAGALPFSESRTWPSTFPPRSIPHRFIPCAGVTHRRGPKRAFARPNRKDLLVIQLDEGAAVARRVHPEPLLRGAGARSAASTSRPCAQRRASARWSSTPATPMRAPAKPGWRTRATCVALARLAGIDAQQILPFSTGVIMEPLPVDRAEGGRCPPRWPIAEADALGDGRRRPS